MVEKEVPPQAKRRLSKRLAVAILALFLFGLSLGFLAGYSVPRSHRCDFLVVTPDRPSGAFGICYTELNIPVTVALCPTQYTIALRMVPDLNADTVESLRAWCTSVRSLVPVGGEQNASQ